jgi:hypothetical protein
MPSPPTARGAAFAPGAPRYTVEQANRTLPYVGRVVADLVRDHAEWRRCLGALDADRRGVARPADDPALAPLPADPAALRRLAARLSGDVEAALGELAALGVECKGLDVGLVDFPAVVGGAPAYLCWQLGEPAVAWWHRPEAGFAGRRPLAELDAAPADPPAAEAPPAAAGRP